MIEVNNFSVKRMLRALGFLPEDGSVLVWSKIYSCHRNYKISVDIDNQKINYGNKIALGDKTICNLKTSENFVVLECVNRLIEKGYSPENIALQKTWATGHGTSGKLDVLVSNDTGSAYLMIECKSYGVEFDKACKRMFKDGGQLFTYFQQDKDAEILMLYSSTINFHDKFDYCNEIIKIEDEYRQTGNVKDCFDRWNKLTKNNGIFEEEVRAYNFQSKALTPKDLKEITQKDSSFIFNQFLEILRHNVVSDKPNAFNKIFTLFLCKIYDEKVTKPDAELAFQWFYDAYQYEGKDYSPDDHISFQKRLTDLYKKGMKEFLDKEVTDISDIDFERKYGTIIDEKIRQEILNEIVEIRLKKNNEFAIKEVFDTSSFEENATVIKEVVELLQGYKIRYTKKQQYLSDFFEMLLTTGLKQESGQFFTPVPIAQFIIKSLPLDKIIQDKLNKGEKEDLLPKAIDYASGGGHFITEIMHEIQRIINSIKPEDYVDDTAKKIKTWKEDHFDWAFKYIYGIEKDYRVVKVGKVGCYLHGDGLAQIIHSDGLGSFSKTCEYKDLLKKTDKEFPKENKQFDIIISNPPYSVSAFKNNARKYYTEEDFEIYKYFTDQSSEIECLFIERTKQLLKDGGIAGIILPSSILSNRGIYIKAREIILKYFTIIAITELGSNSFLATGTNTVVLFLKRKNNYEYRNVEIQIDKVIYNCKDVTINKIEKPITKYVDYVWKGINFSDYITLLNTNPNQAICNHDIYKEYKKKIKSKDEKDFWNIVISLEKEKILYFILAYSQQVVLVKTGEKNEEKKFLGYEFSNRRGSEGIHPIERDKTIETCTTLFDPDVFDNPEKASTYIYQAFQGDFESEILDCLKNNITRRNLLDMLTFDVVRFDTNINLKKTINLPFKVTCKKFVKLISYFSNGITYNKTQQLQHQSKNMILTADNITLDNHLHIKKVIYLNESVTLEEDKKLKKNDLLICLNSGSLKHIGKVAFIEKDMEYYAGGFMGIIRTNENECRAKYLYALISSSIIQGSIRNIAMGNNIYNIGKNIYKIDVPIPRLSIQDKIVAEISLLEERELLINDKINKLSNYIADLIISFDHKKIALGKVIETINPSKDSILDIDDNVIVSFLSMSDVSNEGMITNFQKRKLGDVKSGFTFFQEEDVLVAKITPCMENGKGALIPKLENHLGFGSTEFFVLRSNTKKILPKLLFYITQSKDFRKKAEREMTGMSGHRRVPKSFITNYFISDFSMQEQHKIVMQIENIEKEILHLRKELIQIPIRKRKILFDAVYHDNMSSKEMKEEISV